MGSVYQSYPATVASDQGVTLFTEQHIFVSSWVQQAAGTRRVHCAGQNGLAADIGSFSRMTRPTLFR